MKIAIGTTSAPKVAAVQEAVSMCPYFAQFWNQIEYIMRKVPSDIVDMPLSLEVTLEWARNRARHLLEMEPDADFYVGIEWGAWGVLDKKVLGGTVYIISKEGEEHFGISQAMEIPEVIATRLYENGEELGPVMKELESRTTERTDEWSMAAWSNGMFIRKDEFILAFKAAISPFFNGFYKL